MSSVRRGVYGTVGVVVLWWAAYLICQNLLFRSEWALAVNVLGAGGLSIAAVLWERWARGRPQVVRSAVHTFAYVAGWQLLVHLAELFGLYESRALLARYGLIGLFLIGLAWVVWRLEIESQRFERARLDAPKPPGEGSRSKGQPVEQIWHPFDPEAWYYGKKAQRLNQSLTALTAYSLAFVAAVLAVGSLGGCQETYEMPAGGGEQKAVAQVMKVQKVIKKKFIVNPYSSIVWNPPPIDDVKLQLQELTEHTYTVGYGQGQGAGFSGGTGRGKVRFIRLEYSGGDWQQDFGVGADLNMLIEYGVRTGHAVNDRTESRTVMQLANFPAGKSPPLVYMTGQRNINLSKKEIETLREYIVDKHGMLFCDNGGSQHFHNQYMGLMRQVLPTVDPVPIPLDDVIHRVPFPIPFLPYVAPHGGKEALGWKIDGRWAAYYHPGDIGDAWTDDHSGVPREIWEACYQLGTNVIFYAHAEYNRWLDARRK